MSTQVKSSQDTIFTLSPHSIILTAYAYRRHEQNIQHNQDAARAFIRRAVSWCQFKRRGLWQYIDGAAYNSFNEYIQEPAFGYPTASTVHLGVQVADLLIDKFRVDHHFLMRLGQKKLAAMIPHIREHYLPQYEKAIEDGDSNRLDSLRREVASWLKEVSDLTPEDIRARGSEDRGWQTCFSGSVSVGYLRGLGRDDLLSFLGIAQLGDGQKVTGYLRALRDGD